MRSFLFAFLCGGLLLGATPRAGAGSFLYQPACAIDEELRGPAAAYSPQPGDIYLSTDNALIAIGGHRLAFSGPPHHSGIVFARPDGTMAILEAGPFNGLWVETIDFAYDLGEHERRGEKVWIRRRNTPLTPAQSAKLTEWALAQDGKRFAMFRLLGQITIFRSRGPLRTEYLGGPHGERDSYFCSELVLESCLHAGLLDPETTRPAATYPRDLFFDASVNPYLNEHPPLVHDWHPPARWASAVAGAK
jgi:hypothetical protein